MRKLILGSIAALLGCGPQALEPMRASTFGYVQVTARHEALAELRPPLRVQVGGVAAFGVERVDETTVRFTVQGAPEPGPAAVVVSGRGEEREVGTLLYEGPRHPALRRVVAFGASLTMGSQDANISARGQLHGPAAQLARAAGAYLPLPLVRPGLFPGITADDYDLATCRVRREDVFAVISERAGEMLQGLKDAEGNLAVSRARVEPTVEVRNVAIGGFRLRQVLEGGGDLLTMGLEHMVWNPFATQAELFSEPAQRMLDRVEALQPTLVFSTDLFGNDYNNVNVGAPGIPDLSALTPLDTFREQLGRVLARLDATGAHVFVATGPDATVLPQYDAKIQALKAQGVPDAEAQGWRDAMRARIADYNRVLLELAAPYPRVHVVDLHAEVQRILAEGVTVGDQHLSGAPLGGLLSLDGMHFSDTGYALVANFFIRAMNEALGAGIPEVDPAAVLETDPYSVPALRRGGFACAGT